MAALLAESDAAELLMHVEISTAAGHAAPLLHKLRKHLHDHPRTRLVAVMGNKRSDGTAINLSAAAALAIACAPALAVCHAGQINTSTAGGLIVR